MAITVSDEFKAIWQDKQGQAIPQRLRYKRRYKLGTAYYTESNWSVLDKQDFCSIGSIPQQADVRRNVIKTTVVTLKLPNENNQWIEHAASPSFWAADDVATNGYKATRTLWQVQEGYMLASGTIEWISVFTGIQFRQPKITGKGEYALIEVASNALLLEKADAEEVCEEPGLENCIPATGDGSNVDFESTSTGVDHAKLFEVNGVNLTQGSAWRVANDGEIASAGNTGRLAITAATAPTAGHTVKTSVKRWLKDQLTETLLGLLADEAGIASGDRSIAPVVFPGGLSGSKTIDTQAQWEAGSSFPAIDTTTTPGSILAKSQTFAYTGGQQSFVVPAGVTQLYIDAIGASGGYASVNGRGGRVYGTISVTPGETLYFYVGGAGTSYAGGYNGGGNGDSVSPFGYGGGGASDIRRGGTALGDRVLVAGGGGGGGFKSDDSTRADVGGNGGGTVGGDATNYTYPGLGGTQSAGGAGGGLGTAGALGVGGVGAATGSGGGGGGYYGGGGGGDSGIYSGGGGGGSSLIPAGCSTVTGYGAAGAHGSISIIMIGTYESEAFDILSTPTAWGSLDITETLNGGTITYATASSTNGIAWDAYVNISGGIIQSALKRYFKIRAIITPATGSLVSPECAKLVANFTVSTINISLANHRGRTVMQQMEQYVKLPDYELRFRGDGTLVIGPKMSGSYIIHLTQENGIIDVTEVDYGIPDRVIRAARVRYQGFVSVYGDVEAGASAETIADGDELGKAVIDEDLDQVLVANDLNLGASRARVLYDNNRRSATDPRPPVRLRLKIWDVPWLEVSDVVRVSFYDHPILGVFQANDEMLRADSPYFHMGAPGNVISAAKDWRVLYYNPNKDTGQADILCEEVL